jgi:cell division protein FtsQ
MDGVNRLLGRGIVKFDMRDPDRFVLRLPQGQGQSQGTGQGTGTNEKPAVSAEAPATGEEG